jgi:hypothetical protein
LIRAHAIASARIRRFCQLPTAGNRFKSDLPAIKEPPDGADRNADPAPLQLNLQFCKRDVRRRFDHAEDEPGFSVNAAGFAVSTLRLRREIAVGLQPAIQRITLDGLTLKRSAAW